MHSRASPTSALEWLKKSLTTSMQQARKRVVVVNDTMQQKYSYHCVAKEGKEFAADFKPDLTPKQMLALGVFGGKYMTDCKKEFPDSWWRGAKLALVHKDINLNYFKVDASQPLSVWRTKGWIHPDDPRGWFQWYCRYYMGRRMEGEDARQIKRWRMMTRHIAQISKNCRVGDMHCRPRQRQALLHWAYDSRKC